MYNPGELVELIYPIPFEGIYLTQQPVIGIVLKIKFIEDIYKYEIFIPSHNKYLTCCGLELRKLSKR